MSKKLTLALITLIFICGVYIFLSFSYLKNPGTDKTPHKKIGASANEDTSLMFIPNPLTLSSGQQGSLNIVIDDNKSQVSSKIIQLELSFDPNVVYNLNVYPGNYFPNPEVLYEKIDMKSGRISYAIKGVNQKSADVVASLNFSVVNYGLVKNTEIKFQPKTLIKGDLDNVKLGKTTGVEIVIRPALFQYAPAASSSTKLQLPK